ncbi:MAG: IS630 family transposase [Candidatus Dormibacteraceae bacterium]
MSKQAAVITLEPAEERTLRQWCRAGTTEHRMAERAQMVLLASQSQSTVEIARRLRTRPARVSKWRQRFAQQRLEGLQDRVRSGKPSRYDLGTERRVLAQLDQPPVPGYSTWSGGLVARALGDVGEDQVWRVLRRYGISLQRRRSWCVSTDPAFAPKAADIVGLYLDPPQNALVLAVDEKPSIQAWERAQGWIRLPHGRALTGFSHCYTRHGTTTLFAALDVTTGPVKTGHYHRRRRREFLDFMNEIVADHPDRQIHVVLDNLSTHKPQQDRWRKLHPRVHFHYTPTYASWLNQVECWFSMLSRQALRGASFTSPQQLRQAIDRLVAVYNQTAAPFEWRKAVLHPTAPKRYYANLCN